MATQDNIFIQQTWPIVAACAVLGALLLALGAGHFTEERVPYVATMGAFAVAFAGIVIMWKS